MPPVPSIFLYTDTPTTEIYTLSLPTLFRSFWQRVPFRSRETAKLTSSTERPKADKSVLDDVRAVKRNEHAGRIRDLRSEEHTSELQSHVNLVCRLLLEKKKKNTTTDGSNL